MFFYLFTIIQWYVIYQKNAVDPVQSLYLDTCLTGMGAVWRDRVYATHIQNLGGLNLKIVHLEMLNIVIALKTRGKYWCHSTISMYYDNLRVVFFCQDR